MKNIIIAVVVIAIAVLIYTQLQKGDDAIVTSPPIEEAPAVEEVTAPEPVIETDPSLISSAPDDADVFFLEPGDGTTVSSPVTVKFGATNMAIVPAGDMTENSGHHHLLINMDELPDMTQPLPANDNSIHFGLGQTETTIELEPGEHTLQLVLGNYLHIPHDKPVVSKKITITVE